MNNIKELIELIVKYENFVEQGNTALKQVFNIEKSPLIARRENIIPRSGIVECNNIRMPFKFHGMGCRFEFGDVIVEFDYSFGDFIYKGFESSKLFWFIESYLKSGVDLTNKAIFEQSLLKLEENKIIVKNTYSIDTYDYKLVATAHEKS